MGKKPQTERPGVPSTRYLKHVGEYKRPAKRRTPASQRRYPVCSWRGMVARCCDPAHREYRYYGGLGVEVHPLWLDDPRWFDRDLGPRPSKQHGLRRRDPALGFTPRNTYWGKGLDTVRDPLRIT